MPKIFRTMLADESGMRPRLVSTTEEPGLNVRVPPDQHTDIIPDENGVVLPKTGGMSVAPSVAVMPARLIPMRLRALYRNARGDDVRVAWSMGEGSFIGSTIAAFLELRITSKTHGLVEPSTKMPIAEFQRLLALTQGQWRKDE